MIHSAVLAALALLGAVFNHLSSKFIHLHVTKMMLLRGSLSIIFF